MVCTSLGSLLRPLFYFLCYIHFSLSVYILQLFTLLPTLGYFLFPLCIGQKVVEIGDEESAMVGTDHQFLYVDW